MPVSFVENKDYISCVLVQSYWGRLGFVPFLVYWYVLLETNNSLSLSIPGSVSRRRTGDLHVHCFLEYIRPSI